jgi:hypothetical protein
MEEVEVKISDNVYAKMYSDPNANHTLSFRTTNKVSKEIKLTEKQIAELLQMYAIVRKKGRTI